MVKHLKEKLRTLQRENTTNYETQSREKFRTNIIGIEPSTTRVVTVFLIRKMLKINVTPRKIII